MLRVTLIVAIALAAASWDAHACSPPPATPVLTPPFDESVYAFEARVIGHIVSAEDGPALVLEVLEALTPRQPASSQLTIRVEQWHGCDMPRPMGQPFDPARFPVGSVVRYAARSLQIYTWDAENALQAVDSVP